MVKVLSFRVNFVKIKRSTLINEFEDKWLCTDQKGQSEIVLTIEFDFLRRFRLSKSLIYCGSLLKVYII